MTSIHYVWRRCLNGVLSRKGWLLVALIPVLTFLVAAAITPDRFLVTQDLRVDKDAPVSVPSHPMRTMTVHDVVQYPDDLFLDRFALAMLEDRLSARMPMLVLDSVADIRRIVAETMRLEEVEESRIRVAFYGRDRELGRLLVGFFTQRMQNRVREGHDRETRNTTVANPQVLKSGLTTLIAPLGEMHVESQRKLWREERTVPALTFFLMSLGIVLLVLLTLEWSDPSFKTERQAARYLELPILGSVPDVQRLSGSLR